MTGLKLYFKVLLLVIYQDYCKNIAKNFKKIMTKESDEFVMSQIEMDSIHKYYKGSKVEIITDHTFSLKVDDMEMNSIFL